MSEERKDFWADGSMSKGDMGEIITLKRKHENLEQEEFAEEIGCSLQILKSSENGKGAHVYGTFMKVCSKYSLEVKIHVSEISKII